MSELKEILEAEAIADALKEVEGTALKRIREDSTRRTNQAHGCCGIILDTVVALTDAKRSRDERVFRQKLLDLATQCVIGMAFNQQPAAAGKEE